MEFRELPIFTNIITKIASDDELFALQRELMSAPNRGKLIKKTGGARKIRLAVSGRGKSGGSRIIYYWQDQDNVIWMLTAYLKKDKSNITGSEVNAIAKIINDIKGGLA